MEVGAVLRWHVDHVRHRRQHPDIFCLPGSGLEGVASDRIRKEMIHLGEEFLNWVDVAYRDPGLLIQAFTEPGVMPDSGDDPAQPATDRGVEGAWHQVTVTVYERSSMNRKACIEYYGQTCQACDMSFEAVYGELGINFIHVHHEIPLHSMGKPQLVDPVKDMKPLCPNCHTMVHRVDPPMAVAELRQRLSDIVVPQKKGNFI